MTERKRFARSPLGFPSKQKKYWAVVGSGPNKAAADEIRIKLSELCYKTISSDVVENKKHIDLSAEPLIIVCAAGNPEAVVGRHRQGRGHLQGPQGRRRRLYR